MSFRVYPIIHTDISACDYEITVNGNRVQTNTARVSAVPFNRRWPGHQREIEQSELVQFLSAEATGPVDIEVRPTRDFDEAKVRIRPYSLGIKPTVSEGVIRFTLPQPAYFTVEAWGRSRALHMFIDSAADYSEKPEDEGVIYFGKGEHDAGIIELHSGEVLYIDEGAVVYASVVARDAKNIKIIGRGILDNSKNKEEILFEHTAVGNAEAIPNAKRRHTVQLEYCEGVLIDGITIRDSLVYNIRPIGCTDLTVRGVKIIGCWRYNSDGIDMHNCRRVLVSDCFVRTFDDSICVKGFDLYMDGDIERAIREATYHGGGCYDTFEDVLIEKCVIWNDWGKALEIGAETKAEEIKNISFRGCDLIHLTGPALDCMNVDYADVHDVCFSDINVEADEVIPHWRLQSADGEIYENDDSEFMPETIDVSVVCHFEYSRGITRRGKNRNIRFRNIRVISDKPPKLRFAGYGAENKTECVTVENLYHNGKLIRSFDECDTVIGDFTDDIRLEYDNYSLLSKNTVSAVGQLDKKPVFFENRGAGGKRLLLVGNSITLHGIAPQIGWYRECGMAATERSCDYAHRLFASVKNTDPNAELCICQASAWEADYKNLERELSDYADARDFSADIIVMRVVENIPVAGFDKDIFRVAYLRILDFLNRNRARVILTTSFWHHPADEVISELAEELSVPLVYLGDLGEEADMRAVGQFAHEGVSMHPSDLGMQTIAERIYEKIEEFCKL